MKHLTQSLFFINQIMFETFKVPELFIVNTSVLTMYSTGKKSGLCLEIGDGMAHAVPVWDGCMVPEAVTKADLAGCDLTKFMKDSLATKGIKVTDDVARGIKGK